MSLYNFRDIGSGQSPAPGTPAESVTVNGVAFESLPGVQTLYTKGRESMSAEVETKALPGNGSILLQRRYPERIITVGFQLTSNSPEQFRERWNRVSRFLNFTNAQIIFADEPDKYYIGTAGEVEQPEPGKLTVKAEFQIVCPDPYKYALEETEVSATKDSDGNARFITYYEGDIPVKPSFEVEFSNFCGHVALSDNNGNMLYFGSPNDASNNTTANQMMDANASYIANSIPKTTEGLYSTEYGLPKYHNPNYSLEKYTALGYYTKEEGNYNINWAKANDYGDNQYDYDKNGVPDGIYVAGPAKKFSTSYYNHIIADVTLKIIFSTMHAVSSVFECTFAKSVSGHLKPCFGFSFINDNINHKITFNFYKGNQNTNDARFKTYTIDYVPYVNINSDFSKETSCYMNIKMGKIGDNFLFQYSLMDAEMNVNKTENIILPTGILSELTDSMNCLNMGWFIEDFPSYVYRCTTYNGGVFWPAVGIVETKLTKFTFSSEDISIPTYFPNSKLEVNVNDAKIVIDKAENQGAGVIGNDWDTFSLQPGDNLIPLSYSDWYTGTKGKAKMKYRAVYL